MHSPNVLGECIGLVAPLHGVLGGPCSLVGPVHQGYVGGHDECFLLSDPLPRRAKLSTTSMVPSLHRSAQFRRTLLPRTPVNKAGQASSEALSDYTRGCRRYLRLHGVLLLLAMLARKVLRTVHNDHHDRHRAPQRCEQPRIPNRVSPENIGPMKLPEMVLFMACISMMINTLPLALLNTQLKTITKPMMNTLSDQWTIPTIISGRCHTATPTQRIRLAKSA